jgi:hypothetical protein
MQIKATIEKIPGGMMIVPLFVGVILNTFFPAFLNIGGLTTSLGKRVGRADWSISRLYGCWNKF